MAYKCPHCSGDIENIVPKDRFDQVNNDRKEARASLETLQSDLEAAKAEAAKTGDYQAQLDALQAKIGETRGQYERMIAIARAGVTDQADIDDIIALYERRAPENTPIGDWLSDRGSLPRAVAALLPSASPAGGTAPATPFAPVQGATGTSEAPAAPSAGNRAAGNPASAPAANNGAQSYSGAPAPLSAQAIASMSAEEYRKHRASILGSF